MILHDNCTVAQHDVSLGPPVGWAGGYPREQADGSNCKRSHTAAYGCNVRASVRMQTDDTVPETCMAVESVVKASDGDLGVLWCI